MGGCSCHRGSIIERSLRKDSFKRGRFSLGPTVWKSEEHGSGSTVTDLGQFLLNTLRWKLKNFHGLILPCLSFFVSLFLSFLFHINSCYSNSDHLQEKKLNEINKGELLVRSAR